MKNSELIPVSNLMFSTTTLAMMPHRALLVKQPWASMIVKGEKTWELRPRPCDTAQRVAIAECGTGASSLIGEVTVKRCVRVAHRVTVNGELQLRPWGNPENFIGDNVSKHQVKNWMDIVKYDQVWAWVLERPVEYTEPKPDERKRGQQVWVKLQGPVKRRRTQ